jgi:hypothetical protein
MSNILEFPKNDEQEWRKVAPVLREQLIQAGASQSAIEWVLEDLKPRFLAMSTQGMVSIGESETCRSVVAQVTSIFRESVHQALLQMILLEFALYHSLFD